MLLKSIVLSVITLNPSLPSYGPAKKPINGARIQSSLMRLMKQAAVPGMAIVVFKDGDVTSKMNLGVRNANTQERVFDETVFEAASLSKPVFAYLIFRLIDKGQYDLDKPLAEYMPIDLIEKSVLHHPINEKGFDKEWFSQITARMVLSHSSGLPSASFERLLFKPGSRFSYSPAGYIYLQNVVEYLTTRSLTQLAEELVFKPLGMKRSSFVWKKDFESSAAVGHNILGKTTGKMRKRYLPVSASSLYTTAGDYAKFIRAVLNGTGLKKETLTLMLSKQIDVDENLGYGNGLGIEFHDGNKFIWQWGDFGIYKNFVIINPVTGSGILFLSNSENGMSFAQQLLDMTLDLGQCYSLDWLAYDRLDTPRNTYIKIIREDGYKEALRLLPRFKSEYPEIFDEKGVEKLAYTLLYADHPDAAIEFFKVNTQISKPTSRAFRILADAYFYANNDLLARQNYQKALAIDENDRLASNALVYIGLIEKSKDRSAEELKSILKKMRSNHPQAFEKEVFVKLGMTLIESGRMKDALLVFRSGDILYPNSSIILYGIAHASMELGEFDQALEFSKRALALDGGNMSALWIKSQVENR
jgi:CubicO group peptidase (beta-lactamase class C family)/Tfp pilus assembly protein PilF